MVPAAPAGFKPGAPAPEMTPVSPSPPDAVESRSHRRSGPDPMKFDTRHAVHPSIIETADTTRLRQLFHVSGLFVADDVSLTFSHVERLIIGGVMPVSKMVELNEVPELNKGPFLARRELGIINVGGPGRVSVDGKSV